jgi:DNA-binding XRE family transcriptional regulator
VRELRQEKNMLQGELADNVGVRESFVSDIENAKKEPCLEVTKVLAESVSLRCLFWDL